MAKLVQFLLLLTSDDRRRRRHISEKGRILEFVVQYEIKVNEKWHPVVRYDTAHGYAHIHLFHPDGRQQKRRMNVLDYNLALTIAEDDVRKNWQSYRAKYLKELK